MSYLLRRVIFEDRWQNQLTELIDFCRESGVAEVLFMEQSHQMLMNPWPLAKHRRMAAVYAQMAPELRKHGIGLGINIATLVGHSDADIPARLKLPFQKIVDDELTEAFACYCILDPKWQDYAVEVCRLYANKVKPDRLFVDDDFRPTNHRRFMGCFCPLHAAEVAREYGRKLDSATLLAHIKGGDPEDFRVRHLWQQVHARMEIAIMGRARDAIAAVSPKTQFGLMGNGESSHSVFGRETSLLLDSMTSPGKRPLCRPASAFYRDSDLVQDNLFHIGHRLGESCFAMGPATEVISEVEGWPHTRFMKSLATLRRELCVQAICGAEKFSLNIFDYVASPLRLEPGYAKLLRELRPDLEKIVALRKDKVPRGLAVPWKSDMAAYVSYMPGPGAKSPGGICPDRSVCELMTQLGIPIQYHAGRCNFLHREDPRAFTDEEIRQMLTGGLLLDSTAALALQERGFGDFLGCRIEPLAANAAVLERFDDERFAGPYTGTFCATKWMAVPPRSAIHRLKPASSAFVTSTFMGFDIEAIAPGTVCFENTLGGRVVIFGVPVHQLTWLFTNRAHCARELIRWAGRDQVPVLIEDAVNVGPFYFENPQTGAGLLAVISSSLDEQPLKIKTALALEDVRLPICGAARERIEPLGLRLYATQNNNSDAQPK